MTTAVQLAQSVAPGVSLGFKNRLINGAMMIDQRNAGASVTPQNAYTLDRWIVYATQSSKLTVQQNAGSVTPPVGFVNYAGITSSSAYSVTSTDSFSFTQPIEGYNIADLGWGTANAKTITVSFWVRSSLTGTFGGAIGNGNQTRSYPFTYTISVANTWEQKTVTIAGDTTGTWSTNNSAGLLLFFSVGTGSTKSGTSGSWAGADYRSATGATSVVGTSGATFYITGVQLEVGTTATPFEFRDYGRELILCQRYYQQQPSNAGLNSSDSSGTSRVAWLYKVTMRTSPTVTLGTNTLGTISTGTADFSVLARASYASFENCSASAEL